jgi:hypothetical protein
VLWARLENEECSGDVSDQNEHHGISEEELHRLILCLKWMVSLSERNVYQDRLVKFFGILASMATTRARIQCVEVLVNFLVEWSQVGCLPFVVYHLSARPTVLLTDRGFARRAGQGTLGSMAELSAYRQPGK